MPGGLAIARLLHYAAVTGLFGLSLFPLYATRPSRMSKWMLGLAVAALVSGLAWLLLATANMAGALDLGSVAIVVTEMGFGRVWAARLALAVVIILVLLRGADPPRLTAGLCGLLLVSIALTGHTQIREGATRLIHSLADAVHLAAAGAWLGGLIGLMLMLRRMPEFAGQARAMAAAVRSFSKMAYVAVGALVLSGLVNAVMLVGAPVNLALTGYGRLLVLKLALFAAMLGFAAVNRFVVTPRLEGDDSVEWSRLRAHVFAEQGLGLLVLFWVAVLGLSEPPTAG